MKNNINITQNIVQKWEACKSYYVCDINTGDIYLCNSHFIKKCIKLQEKEEKEDEERVEEDQEEDRGPTQV